MDMPVLRDEFKKVYIGNLAKLVRECDAGLPPKDWLRYCILPWPYYTVPFLSGLKQ